MPGLPNSLLLIMLLAISVGNANAIFDAILVNYTGHVYCTLATDDGSGTSNLEGTLLLPVKNVDLTLMENDNRGNLDVDDTLGTAKAAADGSYHLTGSEWKMNGLEPYVVAKACRTDDPSNCREEKFSFRGKDGLLMVAENANIYMADDFCEQICKDGVCQSA